MKYDADKNEATVLIVDDDAGCRDTLEKLVDSMGYRSLTAENGIEALAIIGIEEIDAMLLDIVMDGIDGIEVLKRLKKNKQLVDVPVIMITGKDNNESTVECMKLGAENYLTKPIEPKKLRDLLPSVIEQAEPPQKPKSSFFNMSLSMTGARVQFGLAITLISILPSLALAYILINPYIAFSFSDEVAKLLLAVCVILIVLGYGLLVKYPFNVIRLRSYLELLAKGSAPEEIHLIKDENDLEAIESCIAKIIHNTEARIRTIKEQSRQLLEAEKKEVMIESLAAACHHLGQPATVLFSYLNIMNKKETDAEMKAMIKECRASAKVMTEVFEKMQNMAMYETEEYIDSKDSADSPERNTIISLN